MVALCFLAARRLPPLPGLRDKLAKDRRDELWEDEVDATEPRRSGLSRTSTGDEELAEATGEEGMTGDDAGEGEVEKVVEGDEVISICGLGGG